MARFLPAPLLLGALAAQSNTIVFPLAADFMEALLRRKE